MFRDQFIDGIHAELLTELGEDVTLNGETVRAVFERDYIEHGLDSFQVMNRDPVIQVLESDNPQMGQTVEFRGDAFTIVELQPDGRGVVTCQLRK